MLTRNEADPRSQVASAVELLAISNGRAQRAFPKRANSRNRREALYDIVVLGGRFDLTGKCETRSYIRRKPNHRSVGSCRMVGVRSLESSERMRVASRRNIPMSAWIAIPYSSRKQ